jgi:organic radical activating enzyme
MVKQYVVNEVFFSLQGEGTRAGTANVFVRFSACNMRCSMEPAEDSPGGFDCDTEFVSGHKVTAEELLDWMGDEWESEDGGAPKACVLTGGEPGLQLDTELLTALKTVGWYVAIETNGSILLPTGLDWITVSPKVAEHAIRQRTASEVKYVRGHGQAIPRTCVEAPMKLLSPAFGGMDVDPSALAWCIRLVKEHPEWRLSLQMHKVWQVR